MPRNGFRIHGEKRRNTVRTRGTNLVTIAERFASVRKVFIDSAPIIYLVEKHPQYFDPSETVFGLIQLGHLTGVTSPITLAECLVIPYRQHQPSLRDLFTHSLTDGKNISFASIGRKTALDAAAFRAQYNLTLTDAFQLASALEANCDAFLTNDRTFRRVKDLDIILLDDFSTA